MGKFLLPSFVLFFQVGYLGIHYQFEIAIPKSHVNSIKYLLKFALLSTLKAKLGRWIFKDEHYKTLCLILRWMDGWLCR
jgi:hypothetical protein